jgi:signal transduction histidine kinase
MRSRFPIPALVITALTVALAIGAASLRVAIGGGNIVQSIAFVSLLAFPAMGLLVIRHRPTNAIGWVLIGIGLNVFVLFLTSDYAPFLVRHPGALPAGAFVAWVGTWSWEPFILMVLLFLPILFPDGRLLSPRWRIVVISGLVYAILALIGNAFAASPTTVRALPTHWASPGLARALARFVDLSVPFGLVALVGCWASVVIRYRRGDSLQRHQLRWFLLAVFLAFIPFAFQGNNNTIAALLFPLLIPLLPISIAVGVLRYRLYDIDVVINRALVYGALASFITVVYVAIVVGIGRLVGSGNRPNLALSILATAVVAVAFQPVRERVQRFANRLVYGRRASPYEVMAGFADQMAGTLSVDDVLPQMAEAAARGVGAQAARVTLRLPDGGDRVTTWPANAGDAPFGRILLVSYRAAPIGEIAVRENPGQPITAGEGRLLADLAGQAGLVLHNVRLTAELQARLADISAQAVELRASRQRIVTAQEGERRRLGREIRTGVQHDLETTAAQLDDVEHLLGSDATAASARLEALVHETQRTLDALRELARGVFPSLLADQGIVPALEAHTRKTTSPASIQVDAGMAGARFDPGVEAAVYFCCTEGLRGFEEPAAVHLAANDGVLTFTIDGAAALNGRLEGLRDRVEALGGALEEDTPGRVRGRVPARPLVMVG